MTDLRERFREADLLTPPDLWPEIRRRVAEPAGRMPAQSDPRGSRLVAGAVAFAVFLGGALLAARVFLGSDERERPRSSDAWADVPPGWTQLASPPFARSDPVAVWTGTELIVWGGGTDYNANFFADGAIYDPVSNSWRAMADGPLEARADARAVWTGSEVLMWGGYGRRGPLRDGAAYEPATDTWRNIPPVPIELGETAVHVWTGRELIVLSVLKEYSPVEGIKGMGAAYDPAEDSWRRIAFAPLALNAASAVWTGDEAILFGADLDSHNRSDTRWAQGLAYDPETDSWRVLPEHHISPQASSASWTGSEMLVWDYDTSSALYDPATNSWREPNEMPIEFSECYPYSVSTSEIVFASFCNQMAQFDIAADRWEPVLSDPIEQPTPPNSGALPVAAGEVVVVLIARPDGNDYSGELSEIWAYRPG